MGPGLEYSLRDISILLFLNIIFIFSINVLGQDSPAGFISIDCGSSGISHDNATQLLWVGDGEYGRSGRNGQVQNPAALDYDTYSHYNYAALQTFRYFYEEKMKSKYCYELPLTRSNISFLIRAMFLHGNASELPLPIQFDVYVNTSFWMEVNFTDMDDLNSPKVRESIFFSPIRGNVTYICLVPKQGVPFISSLELRELDPEGLMYTSSFIGHDNIELFFTKSVGYNFVPYDPQHGYDQAYLRYPDDIYDRLWESFILDGSDGIDYGIEIPKNWSTIGPEINSVPSKVMESAWLCTYDGYLAQSFELPITVPGSLTYGIFYFASNTSTPVVQQITLDGTTFWNPLFTVTSTPSQQSYFHVLNSNQTALVFKSPFVLNAMEFYTMNSVLHQITDRNHVYVVNFIKDTLNLTSWQGDPCTPTPYDWIGCYLHYQPSITSEYSGSTWLVDTLELSHLVDVSGLSLLQSEEWIGEEGLTYLSITNSNVDSNLFKSLLQTFVQPAWLISLNMSFNNISIFPDNQWWLDTVNISYWVSKNLAKNLTLLDLSYNSLTQIPCFGNIPFFSQLQILNLSNNKIAGEFPDIECFSKLQNLKVLILSNNFLEGKIPSSLSIQNLPSLRKLDISNNKFSGQVPNFFYNEDGSNSLESLNMSFNDFNAFLDSQWGSDLVGVPNGILKNLTSVDLSFNNLTQIPCFSNFPYFGSLQILNLSNNMISGEILDIECFTNLTALEVLNISNNYLRGSLPSSLSIQKLPSLRILDISTNQFSGQFPTSNFFAEGDNSGDSVFQSLHADNNDFSGSLDLNQWYRSLQALSESICNDSLTYHQVFSFVNNKISGVVPKTELFESLITTLIRQEDFNQSGVLLGGNPYCEGVQYFAQKYLCRLSLNETVDDSQYYIKRKSEKATIIGSVVGGVLVLFFFASFTFVIWRLSKRVSILEMVERELANRSVQPPFYSYADLKSATNNFQKSNFLGKGTFGVVYKGVLSDGTTIAVKRLFNHNKNQVLNEFLNEVVLLTGIKHKNLAELKGCCIERGERILVYTFAENGNLADTLWGEGTTTLSWEKRYEICVGLATGLRYLHEEIQPRIIHRDVKPANILLDKNFTPKIADFGLAKGVLEDDDHITQMICGTRGYFAPEYYTQGLLTTKADVFSFGVVTLEIVSGRKCLNPGASIEELQLLSWASKLQSSGSALKVLDPALDQSSYSIPQVLKLVHIALMCVEGDPGLRPAMSKVEAMLLEDEDRNYDTLCSAFLQRGRENSVMERMWKSIVGERSTSAAYASAFSSLRNWTRSRSLPSVGTMSSLSEESLLHESYVERC